MATSKKHSTYERQKLACKSLGIKPPPENMGLFKKLKFVYKQLKG